MSHPNPATDILSTEQRLSKQGWISRRSEAFQHQPPPPLTDWLAPQGQSCAASDWRVRLADSAWQQSVCIRRLNMHDTDERAFALGMLPENEADDAAAFALAHRISARDALHIRIQSPADATLASQICWIELELQGPAQTPQAPLLILELAAGLRCGLLEQHSQYANSAASQNLQAIIKLGNGAELDHLRWVQAQPNSTLAHIIHADLGAQAQYRQAVIASASHYHLQRSNFLLTQADASARQGVLLFASQGQIDHQAYSHLRSTADQSHVESLTLAQGAAKVVSNSYTEIAAGATDADISQHLAGIPISGQPRMVLRPHLEISHDQVQASHGATWGALSEAALFYAAQRGLDPANAKRLVMEGMARAVLERNLSAEALERWLTHDELAPALAQLLLDESEASHGA